MQDHMDSYQKFIALSRYSKFDYEKERRETWDETVFGRFKGYWRKKLPDMPEDVLNRICQATYNLETMPSMRTLMAAGPALERDEAAAYNCSAAAVTATGPEIDLWDSKLTDLGIDEPIKIRLKHPKAFDEFLYILLVGTGAGFSVERQFINELPTIGRKVDRSIYKPTKKNYPGVEKAELSTFDKKANKVIVADSKYGWASALRIFVVEMYNGNFDAGYDTSAVRKAGAPLRTFGGRASGPQPLIDLFEFIRTVFRNADGRKLNSIECHDIMCKIGSVVVVGGVRRTALISLSNLSDDRMRYAKSGEWWETEPQRAYANNSTAYTEKPEIGAFMREWQALYESKSGERGIFNRVAAKKACDAIGRDSNHEFVPNP